MPSHGTALTIIALFMQESIGRRGYHVAHNVYFLDRDEGKGREIDLRGLKNAFFERGGTSYAVRHCLLLECKKSASRPWVVFTSPTVSYDQTVNEIHTRGAKNGLWFTPSREQVRRFEAAHPWLSRPQRGRSFSAVALKAIRPSSRLWCQS